MKKIPLSFALMTALLVLGACTDTSTEDGTAEDSQTTEESRPTETSDSSHASVNIRKQRYP